MRSGRVRWAAKAVAVVLLVVLMPPLRSARAVNAVAQLPVTVVDASFGDAQHGWTVVNQAATSGALFATADGGHTWAPQTLPLARGLFDGVAAIDRSHAWALADNGAYVTANGGSTWRLTTLVTATGAFDITAVDAAHAWAALGNAVGRTSDGGLIWTVSVVPWSAEGLAFSDTRHGWAAGNALLAHTTDGGVLWTTDTLPAGLSGVDFHSIAATGAQSAVAVGDGFVNNLYQGVIVATADGGRTWATHTLPQTPPRYLHDVAFGDGTHGWAAGLSCPAPNPCTGVLYGTADGGATWVLQASYGDDLETVTARSASRAWAGGHRCETPTILATGNGGATWNVVADTTGTIIAASSLSFVSSTIGWVSARTMCGVSQLMRSTDGGRTWTRQSSPAGDAGLQAIGAADASHAWAAGTAGALFGGPGEIAATANGGSLWTNESVPLANQYIAVSPIDSSHAAVAGYFCTPGGVCTGGVATTADGGVSWSAHASPVSLPAAMAFVSPAAGWLGGGGGCHAGGCAPELAKTSDGGATWQSESVPLSGEVAGISFPDALHGWAVSGNGIVSTSDGGGSWQAESVPAPGGPPCVLNCPSFDLRTVHFVDDLHGWAGGAVCSAAPCSPAAVLATTDGGSTWTEQSLPAGMQYADSLSAVDAQHVWVGGLTDCDTTGFSPHACWVVVASTDGGASWTRVLDGSNA